MIITTKRGTIVSDQPDTYLRNESGTTRGSEIRLGNTDSIDNYTEITLEEYKRLTESEDKLI